MLNFSLGGCIRYFQETQIIFDILDDHPEWRNKDTMITSIFDCFPSAIWNSGRPYIGKKMPAKTMRNIVRYYNDRHISVRYTYSNPLLKAAHLQDRYCNQTMEIAHDHLNAIIINSPILEAYVREQYPKYRIIASATLGKKKCPELKERIKDVDILVFPADLNTHYTLFKQLPCKKIELIVNELCTRNCPLREAHFKRVSEQQLRGIKKGPDNCLLPQDPHLNMIMSIEEARAYHRHFGITNFKIANRYHPFNSRMSMFANYLIAPEHIDTFCSTMREKAEKHHLPD